MRHLHQHFRRSIQWNTLESCVFHGIFLLHQLALFAITSGPMYGIIGSIFSFIYICASFINLGLDATITPLFIRLTHNRTLFKKFILTQLIPNLIFGMIITGIVWCLLYFIPNLLGTYANMLSMPIFGMILGIILLESLKKTMRTILQLALYPHVTALIEIGIIMSYTTLVWGWYVHTNTMHLYALLLPMLVVSLLGTFGLLWHVYAWYCTLPLLDTTHTISGIDILKNRTSNTIYQVSTLLFSTNFLVPFFAFKFGLEYAGLLKIISYIAHSVSIILQKIFGTASNILLSNIKNCSLSIKRNSFLRLTSPLNQILYGLIIFFIINHRIILAANIALNPELQIKIALCCLVINLVQNFFIAYEKFFIMEEKTHYLAIVNGIALLFMYLLAATSYSYSPLTILLLVLVIRSIALILLGIVSFYTWQLNAAWQPHPYYFIGSLSISFIFFFISS